MAYDVERREMTLVGGFFASTFAGPDLEPMDPVETWTRTGTSWQLRHVGDGVDAGQRSAAYDTGRNVLVSFGSYLRGCTQSFPGPCDIVAGTREWDGERWTQKSPKNSPAPSFHHAMTFDSRRGVTVLFGGWSAVTWEWDGTDWTQKKPATSPTVYASHGLTFDSRRSRTVLFGGWVKKPVAETWEWDGVNWQRRTPATVPPARSNPLLAYDPVRGRTVLFGGWNGKLLRDTWEWDGTNWWQIRASGPPGTDQAMGWDPSRRKIVLYAQDQLWAFDGTIWSRIQTVRPLPKTDGGTIAFDAVRQSLIFTYGRTTRLIGNVAHASAQRSGAGCPGGAGVPRISSELPRLGTRSFGLVVDSARPAAPTLFALSSVWRPVRFGPCTWFLGDPMVLLATTSNAQGHAEVPLPIAVDPSWRGLALHAQALVLNPTGAAFGFALSSGLQLLLGD